MTATIKKEYDISVVIPVYNEQGCIRQVVSSWADTLSELGIKYLITVLNDGSHDKTSEILSAFVKDKNIRIINKENEGHGPTILLGYKEAVSVSDWVFQCDGDDELKPADFPLLWKNRLSYDALFGKRTNRNQNLIRKFISKISVLVVHIFFGNSISDVNVPYRLIRSDIVEKIVNRIPTKTFAPNVIISGVLSKAKLRIYEHPVSFEPRKTGKTSIVKLKLWKSAFKSFFQTVVFSLKNESLIREIKLL
ncbi:glycosyltransferase family 2 protein [Candidatus Magnetomonas plexicatena]|uniref:glycosyltransferase family 2 protein n=1 Tax=Candidatus Magnetomonas plexicatena TaxID=2552947 RepID=UPI001C77920C|nr:glycosyltransferase family 2 protein [Nitrospirales bacterium LBB_01]